MKKKNGFTLIELLAIIVILAIIAVITVPIILNIIDSSKKGAIKDSAYGYKDAVNKFYVSKLSQDKNYTIPNNSYATTTLKNLGVTVSGQEPGTNSWVTIENNNVVAGCLQFDEYKVEIKNSVIGETKNGECIELQIPSCPGCVFAYYTTAKNYSPAGEGDILENGKTDYNEVVEESGKNSFLGHILDNDGKIERAFVCHIYNDEPFCIEGTIDGSKHESNKALLYSIYGQYSSTTNIGCDLHGTILDCTDSTSWATSTVPCGYVSVAGCNATCNSTGTVATMKCN